jgi:hypothetical protein
MDFYVHGHEKALPLLVVLNLEARVEEREAITVGERVGLDLNILTSNYNVTENSPTRSKHFSYLLPLRNAFTLRNMNQTLS